MDEIFGKWASGGQNPQDFFASEGLCLIPGSGVSHRFDFQMDVKIRNYQRVSRGRGFLRRLVYGLLAMECNGK